MQPADQLFCLFEKIRPTCSGYGCKPPGQILHLDLLVVKRFRARKHTVCPTPGTFPEIGFSGCRSAVLANIIKFAVIVFIFTVVTGHLHGGFPLISVLNALRKAPELFLLHVMGKSFDTG